MFVADRTWNAESIASFRRKRDEQRSKEGSLPFETLEEEDKATALQEERSLILDNKWNRLTLGVRHIS